MEIFFDNSLTNLPFELFLMLWVAVNTAALIAFYILKHQFDHTKQMSLPPIPVNPDAYEIAFLRGDSPELARSVIFALNQKGFLQVDTDVNSKTAVVRQTATKLEKHELNPLEQRVYDWFAAERTTRSIFSETRLLGELDSFTATYEKRLRQHNLLTNESMQSRVIRFKWWLSLGVAALGSYRLYADLVYDDVFGQVDFLLLMTLLGAFTFMPLFIFYTMSGLPRVSALGRLYLERLQLAFDGLKSQIQINKQVQAANAQTPLVQSAATFSVMDPMLLAVAVFGVDALAGTAYDNYQQAFHLGQQQGNAGHSAGCGSIWDIPDSGG